MSPAGSDDMFLGVKPLTNDTQSYHEGLMDALVSPSSQGNGDAAKRRISEPDRPIGMLIPHKQAKELWSVSEENDPSEEAIRTHMVSHTQSLEDLRPPRPLSHVMSAPEGTVELPKSVNPGPARYDHTPSPRPLTTSTLTSALADDMKDLDRNMSCSMENLLYISSPETSYIPPTATASLPPISALSGSDEGRPTVAEFAASTGVTMHSPEHTFTTSMDNVHSVNVT